MKFLGIIPARYASTRFPAKPLAILGGKTVPLDWRTTPDSGKTKVVFPVRS